MGPLRRTAVIKRSQIVIALVALAFVACDNTPGMTSNGTDSEPQTSTDAGVDGGVGLHTSTPTIIRYSVKQVCVPGSAPEDGISVTEFFDVIDDQGTSPWHYRLVKYRNPDGGPGLIEETSPSIPAGNYSYPADSPVNEVSTSPQFSFDLPFLLETYVDPAGGAPVFSGSKTAFIEPVDGGCP
jgi:hypothetical protein